MMSFPRCVVFGSLDGSIMHVGRGCKGTGFSVSVAAPTQKAGRSLRVGDWVGLEPERIILFGSAARGETGPDSDIDLLVIKEGAHRRKLAQAIYRRLLGIGRAVDVVVVTPEDIECYQDTVGLVIRPALEEGRTIYAA